MRVRRIVDLSVPIEAGMPVYPGDPAVEVRPATTLEAHGYRVLHVAFGSHTGTHVDAPSHVVADGETLEDLDPSRFCGPAVIADVTGLEPRSTITWDRLGSARERLGPGAILVLRTGWSEAHLRTPRYVEHPHLDPDAAERALEAGVRTLAIDALNPDPTMPDGDLPVHARWLGAGGVIAENLTNLSAVRDPAPLLCLFPIRLGAGADGAPCRAVALELER